MTRSWESEQYKENSIPQALCALDAIQHYPFLGHECVLDVGCGDGKITAEIAKRIPQGTVRGIDASESMIAAAASEYAGIDNLSFEQTDAASIVTDLSFDLIVSFSALHWIPDQLALFKRFYQLLKTEGRLLIRTAGGENPQIAAMFNDPHWSDQFANNTAKFHANSAEVYAQQLKEAGFQAIQTKTLSVSYEYPNQKALIDWLMGWVPYATGLKKGLDLTFSEKMAKTIYADQNKATHDPIVLFTPLAHIEAART